MIDPAIGVVRRQALELDLEKQDADRVLDLVGDAKLVLLGEASHGTHEFYRVRADITRALIAHRGFQRDPDRCRVIGFTTHVGTVTAAPNWDDPAELMTVRPSLPGSYERLFHDAGLPAFVLPLGDPELGSVLGGPRLERAIGVIYRPETERASHYFTARLPQQFDAVIHIDATRAVEPLEKWSRHELDLPETYPTGV
jgi:erythromycin esterase-like protein